MGVQNEAINLSALDCDVWPRRSERLRGIQMHLSTVLVPIAPHPL
jgi:hypothetical protein